ncbi:MAG: type II TA system antitoxin MqsA family protein [Thermoleophilia bacterium]
MSGYEVGDQRGRERSTMKPYYCSECEEGLVGPVRGKLAVDFRHESYELNGVDYLQCNHCGAISFTREQDRAIEIRAASEARAAQGLLTGEQIIQLRTYLNRLSQSDLEGILEVAPKTVTRWERGTVFQSHANDSLLRVIRTVAEMLDLPSKYTRAELVEILRDLPGLIGRRAAQVAAIEKPPAYVPEPRARSRRGQVGSGWSRVSRSQTHLEETEGSTGDVSLAA